MADFTKTRRHMSDWTYLTVVWISFMFRDVRNCIDGTSSYVKNPAAKQIPLGTKTDIEKGL